MEDVNRNPLKRSPIPSAEDLSPKPRERTTTPVTKRAALEAVSRPADFAVPKRQSRGSSFGAPALANSSTPEVKSSIAPSSINKHRKETPINKHPKEAPQPLELAAVADTATASAESPFATVFKGVEEAYDALIITKKGVKMSSLLNKIYFTYRFPNYKDGTSGCHKIPVREVLHYNSKMLLQTLDKAKYGKLELWPFLEELSKSEFRPVAYKASDFPISFVPRKSMPRQPKSDVLQPPAGPSTRNEEDSSPVPRGKTLKRPGRKPGSKSSLRLVKPPLKRRSSQLESESESEASGLKNSHYFSDGDDAMPDAPEAQTTQQGGHGIANGVLGAPEEEPIKILIRAEKIPSTVPRGPDNTWTCEQDGCDYIVRGSDDDECQSRIRNHFRDHEQQVERVSLAVTESRPHLPIKYAFFPPFLIQVQFSMHGPLFPPAPATSRCASKTDADAPPNSGNCAAAAAAALTSPPASASARDPPPDLSGSAVDAFRDIVQHFRRERRPVSDRIHGLTVLQSFAPEDQAHGREDAEPAAPAADGQRRGASTADQTETDSVTLGGDD